MESPENTQRQVAVVIPAHNEEATIMNTIRACRAIPGVDLVIVVDDGSSDRTQDNARAAGAVVVRHVINRGKSSAMETGAKVAFMRDPAEGLSRLLLFLDGDLGESSAEAYPLVEAVQSGIADCAVAVLPAQKGAGGRGFVMRAARSGIYRATGWEPMAPLSGQRCLSREVFEDCMPMASGWGAEVGMTIDLLSSGHSMVEVPCDIHHRATGNDRAGYSHRLGQLLDVYRAVLARWFTHTVVPYAVRRRASDSQKPLEPYHPMADK